MAAKKKAAKKAVKPQPSAGPELPKGMDYADLGISGFEHTNADDLGLPFLNIVQKGSPEVDKTHKDYATMRIEGCEVGAIVNSLSREILYQDGQEPLLFTPCTHQKLYVEWRQRKDGGGFVQSHQDPDILKNATRNDKNQDILPNGNIIQTTSYFFGSYVDASGTQVKAILGMTSTQLKKARLWLNSMLSRKAMVNGKPAPVPMFGCEYGLTTQPESNDKGSWFGWNVECAGFVTDRNLLMESAGWAKQAIKGRDQLLLGAAAGSEATGGNEPPENVL